MTSTAGSQLWLRQEEDAAPGAPALWEMVRLPIAAAMKKFFWSLWLGMGAWLFTGAVALACPMCQEAISSQNDPAFGIQLTQGYARSIALMMATPYVVFLGVTLLIVRSVRRSKR